MKLPLTAMALMTMLSTGCAIQETQTQYWQSKGYSAEAIQRMSSGDSTEQQERSEQRKVWAAQRQIEREKYCNYSEHAREVCRIHDRIRLRYLSVPSRRYYHY